MRQIMPVSAWYVLSALLSPVGYVVQDVVADAMTVEAVPRVDAEGRPIEEGARKLMHTTMQTLGRVAIIGGGVLVAVVNIWMFADVEQMPAAVKASVYLDIYSMALVIPVVSVLGVVLARLVKLRDRRRLRRQGFARGRDPRHARRDLRAAAAELVDPRWQPGVRGLHDCHGDHRHPLQPGDHLRRLHGHRGLPHVAPGAGAGAGGPPRPGGHRHRHLRLPGDADARARAPPGG